MNIKSKKIVIAVIIPVHNNLVYTKVCLNTLSFLILDSVFPDFEFQLVVVDDGSTDGTSDWIKNNFPLVHLLNGNGNLWWSGGINRGVKYSFKHLNAEYILWWNNDIQPSSHYFENLVKTIKDNNNHVIIGSKIFILNKNIIWSMGGKFNAFTGKLYMYGENQEDSSTYKKPISVDWFPGMGTTIPRSVFKKIGMLDETNFPQYHGDSDYTIRAKKAGFNLTAFPELIIFNDRKNSGLKHKGILDEFRKSFTSTKSYYNIKKDIFFYRKHANSLFAYLPLCIKYFNYIGGFYKWTILNAFGIKKYNK